MRTGAVSSPCRGASHGHGSKVFLLAVAKHPVPTDATGEKAHRCWDMPSSDPLPVSRSYQGKAIQAQKRE